MTYREKIQQLIEIIDKASEEAEALRDYANEHEKFHWNHFRGGCIVIVADLQKLDNGLSNVRASMEID